MSFLYPAFLLGALAIAIPIVLHFLRRDVAPDLPFTAVRLLKRSPVERSKRRRLRDILLLAARVAALLLLAAAFARPFAPAAESASLPLRIVAVDRSFSMGAPGRFERARELAWQAIDEAGFRERVALVAFDDRVDLLAAAGPAADARRALETLAVGYGGTRYGAVVSRAAELAAGGSARLIVVTDLQRAGWEGESRIRVPETLTIEIRDAGAHTRNVALVGTRVEEQGIVAAIRNSSSEPRAGAIVVTHESREAARGRYDVPPSGAVDVLVPWKPTAGGVVVEIEDEGGYPADDRRHLVVGAAAVPSVLVVASPESPGQYIQRALEAAQAEDVSSLRPRVVTHAEIAGGRAEAIARHRAVVLLSTRSLDRAARETIATFVRSGGGLFIAAGSDIEPADLDAMFDWKLSGVRSESFAAPTSFSATDLRHPIFRPFGGLTANLGQVRFARAWQMAADDWQVPARFDDGTPAVLERREGEGRVVLFASDVDRRWNDFPLHPSFLPFVIEAVRHVASRGVEASEFLVGRAPAGVSQQPGIHRLEAGRTIAINVDERESGIARTTADEFVAMLEPVPGVALAAGARGEQAEARQSLWQYGLLLMLGVLVVESLVGRP